MATQRPPLFRMSTPAPDPPAPPRPSALERPAMAIPPPPAQPQPHPQVPPAATSPSDPPKPNNTPYSSPPKPTSLEPVTNLELSPPSYSSPLTNTNIIQQQQQSPSSSTSPQSKHINKLSDSDSEDYGMRLITIAGENRGALMEIASASSSPSSSSPSKNKLASKGYILGNKQGIIKSDHDEEDNKHSISQPIPPSFFNSNVQGLNNSILFTTTCHHNNPGIHLSHGSINNFTTAPYNTFF